VGDEEKRRLGDNRGDEFGEDKEAVLLAGSRLGSDASARGA